MEATMNRHLISEGDLMQTASASAKTKSETQDKSFTEDADPRRVKAVNINDDSAEVISRLISQITVDKMVLFNFNKCAVFILLYFSISDL